MTRDADKARRDFPRCPRCGYDVSGDCGRWQTQCPLEGTCPECGLTFEWHYLLNPALAAPPWLFDTNPSRFWGPLVKTLVRSLWPPKIARALRIEQHFRLKRSLILSALCALAVHLMAMVCGTVLELDNANRWSLFVGSLTISGGNQTLWDTLGEVTMTDFAFPNGPGSRRLLWPYADWTGQSEIRPGDLPLWHVAWLWLVLTPVAFWRLATTLKFAKARLSHIARTSCHIVPTIAVFLLVHLLLGSWAFYRSIGSLTPGSTVYRCVEFYYRGFSPLWLIGVGVVLFWWWRRMIRDYMRLPHANAVTGATLVISLLAAALVAYFIDRNLIQTVGNLVRSLGIA